MKQAKGTIKQAKAKYPVGTKFYQFGGSGFLTKSTGEFVYSHLDPNDICLNDDMGTYVYQKGKWAKIAEQALNKK